MTEKVRSSASKKGRRDTQRYAPPMRDAQCYAPPIGHAAGEEHSNTAMAGEYRSSVDDSVHRPADQRERGTNWVKKQLERLKARGENYKTNIKVHHYKGERIAMNPTPPTSNGRKVDRSGRHHREWRLGDGTILTDPEQAIQQGVPLTHTCMGSGYSGDSGFQKQVKKTMHSKHHIDAEGRRRLRCDRNAPNDTAPDRQAWQWPRGAGALRPIDVHIGRSRPESGSWCQWAGKSHVFLASTHFEGVAQPSGCARVRSWNRFVAAATTQRSKRGPGRAPAMSVDEGRRIWRLRAAVAAGWIQRPKEIGEWNRQRDIIDYDTKRVIYAIVPRRRGEFPYVGQTGQTAWERHTNRLEKACGSAPNTARMSPFELHLHRIGRRAAEDYYYHMILEHVPIRATETEEAWAARIKCVEKFWVHTLRTAYNIRGWNVEHAPATMQHGWQGKPRRRQPGQQCAEGNGRSKRCADRRRQATAAAVNSEDFWRDGCFGRDHHLAHCHPHQVSKTTHKRANNTSDDDAEDDTFRGQTGRCDSRHRCSNGQRQRGRRDKTNKLVDLSRTKKA